MSVSVDMIDDKEINEALRNVLDIVEMEQEREYVSNAELFDQLLTAFSLDLSSQLIPSSVSKDYSGVHLGHIYEDNDLKHLLKSFKNNQPLDAFYALKIINDATEKLKTMPNIRECLIDDPLESGCIIVGDLHGNFNDLYHIIQKYGLPGSQYKFIFNGDFVDRGSKQMEVLLTLLYSFLIRPNKVFLNRGNHEDISLNTNRNFEPNLMTSMRNVYGKFSSHLFTTTNDLFTCLPLATILSNTISNYKYFIVHGGISDSVDLDYLRSHVDRFKFKKVTYNTKIESNREKQIVSDLLWSDPIRVEKGKILPRSAPKKTGCYFNEKRNLGCLFGYDVTENFCKKYKFNGIIRSHELRENGYSEDHFKCYTVFSASYYCSGSNFGSVFKFDTKEKSFDVHTYKTSSNDLSSLIVKNNHLLIRKFKKLIQLNQRDLLVEFEKYDVQRNGLIKTRIWADVLASHFKNEISVGNLISLKDLLCECETLLDVVNYRTLFSNKNGQMFKTSSLEDKSFLNVVSNLFDILDRNRDGRISLIEAEDALAYVNQKIGKKYSAQEDCVNFIKQLDKNGDNLIDLDEFKKAFLDDEDDDDVKVVDESIDSETSDGEEIQIVRL